MATLSSTMPGRAAPAPRGVAREKPAPRTRRAVLALAGFGAVTAIAGGVELIVWPHGNAFVPRTLLEHTAFSTFLVPGLLLAIVVGGASAACAVATWRRSAHAVDLTLLAGGAMTVWIVAEAAQFREVHGLHVVYATLGAALLALGVAAAVRGGGARHRWVVWVTAAEAAGFLAPALAGVAAARAGLDGAAVAALLVAAGLVEGLALGAGQARAMPVAVPRARFAVATSLAAGVVWASVMLAQAVGGAAWVVAGVAGLLAIGGAQAWVMRRHVARAARWIAWTALAWTVALPLSFAPGPLVDEATPAATIATLWACAGLAMAYVLAVVSWQGARQLRPRPGHSIATR